MSLHVRAPAGSPSTGGSRQPGYVRTGVVLDELARDLLVRRISAQRVHLPTHKCAWCVALTSLSPWPHLAFGVTSHWLGHFITGSWCGVEVVETSATSFVAHPRTLLPERKDIACAGLARDDTIVDRVASEHSGRSVDQVPSHG